MIYGNHKLMFFPPFLLVYREISNVLTHQKLEFAIQIAHVNIYEIMFENKNMVNELVNTTFAVFIKRSRI